MQIWRDTYRFIAGLVGSIVFICWIKLVISKFDNRHFFLSLGCVQGIFIFLSTIFFLVINKAISGLKITYSFGVFCNFDRCDIIGSKFYY